MRASIRRKAGVSAETGSALRSLEAARERQAKAAAGKGGKRSGKKRGGGKGKGAGKAVAEWSDDDEGGRSSGDEEEEEEVGRAPWQRVYVCVAGRGGGPGKAWGREKGAGKRRSVRREMTVQVVAVVVHPARVYVGTAQFAECQLQSSGCRLQVVVVAMTEQQVVPGATLGA